MQPAVSMIVFLLHHATASAQMDIIASQVPWYINHRNFIPPLKQKTTTNASNSFPCQVSDIWRSVYLSDYLVMLLFIVKHCAGASKDYFRPSIQFSDKHRLQHLRKTKTEYFNFLTNLHDASIIFRYSHPKLSED